MKKITLPIIPNYKITSAIIDMGLDEIATMPFITRADGTKTLPDGGIDFTETNQVFSVIQSNGAQILYATTWLESQLESILMYYFMGNDELESKKNELFKHEVLESSHFSFQFKKTLLIRIIETLELLEGKEKRQTYQGFKKSISLEKCFCSRHA